MSCAETKAIDSLRQYLKKGGEVKMYLQPATHCDCCRSPEQYVVSVEINGELFVEYDSCLVDAITQVLGDLK